MNRSENRDLKPPVAHMSAEPRIDAAIEAKPPVNIPDGFAAKVAALAVAQESRGSHRVPQIGRRIALIVTPIIAVALFALAPHSAPNVRNVIFDTELILVTQLAFIGWGLTRGSIAQDSRHR